MDSPPLPEPGDLDGETDDDYVPVVVHKRERLLGPSSYLLLAALLVVGGFVSGAKWKSAHPASTTSAGNGNAAAAAFAGRGASAQGTAAGGAAATPGGATVGQVKLVDGTNVYVQDAGGNVVKVATGAGTTVEVQKAGTVADLKAGDTVVVQGTKGADGTIAATSIGSGTGFGAGGFGRRPATPSTTAAG